MFIWFFHCKIKYESKFPKWLKNLWTWSQNAPTHHWVTNVLYNYLINSWVWIGSPQGITDFFYCSSVFVTNGIFSNKTLFCSLIVSLCNWQDCLQEVGGVEPQQEQWSLQKEWGEVNLVFSHSLLLWLMPPLMVAPCRQYRQLHRLLLTCFCYMLSDLVHYCCPQDGALLHNWITLDILLCF